MKDKKALVVGMGRSGKAAVAALVNMGAAVSVQDSKTEDTLDREFLQFLQEKGIDRYLGRIPEDMSTFATIVLSPGVPPALEFIHKGKAA